MEEIKVGEYVRSKDGIIAKVTRIDSLMLDTDMDIYDIGGLDMMEIPIEEVESYIIKHSPNIIDLVEKDDYVNGYKVLYDYKETDKEQCNGEYRKCIIVETKSGEWKMVDWDIKSIVTHEQFNSMKYVVGGTEE